MSDDSLLGRFVWYELLTSDPEAATRFYTELIGWGTAQWEGGSEPYTIWTNGDTPIGGVISLPEVAKQAGAPPHWLAYLGTPDVEATVSQVKELGGEVLVAPTQVPTVGNFAVLSDPQEAAFAVFNPTEPPPEHAGPAQAGEFSWHELATTDHAAAFEFYHAIFGWEKTESLDMGPMGIYQMYGRASLTLGRMYNQSAETPGPPHWLLYTRVKDVDQTTDIVKKLGGTVLNGPMEVPGGDRITQCMDPQGASFAIHSTAGQED